MSKDNRARPRIHRTDDKHDKALRAYATEHGIEPWRALEIAIQRLAWTDGPTIDTLRADLESAREATRRADAEIERITADWRAALAEVERVKALALERAGTDATEIKRLREQYEAALDAVPSAAESRADRATISALRSELAEVRAALATKGADRLAERVETIAADAPKIPRKLMARVKARIKARPNANPPRTFLFVLENGCDRLEASDRYQDKVKRANRIKRAVARMPRKTKRAAKGA